MKGINFAFRNCLDLTIKSLKQLQQLIFRGGRGGGGWSLLIIKRPFESVMQNFTVEQLFFCDRGLFPHERRMLGVWRLLLRSFVILCMETGLCSSTEGRERRLLCGFATSPECTKDLCFVSRMT